MNIDNFEILYHNSDTWFEVFKHSGKRIASMGVGHYLSSSKDKAEQYGECSMTWLVDTSNVLDWANLTILQKEKISSVIMEYVPLDRLAGFGEMNIMVLPANESGIEKFNKLIKSTKNYYHDSAKARILTDDEIDEYEPNLLDKIDLDDVVVGWKDVRDLKLAQNEQLMNICQEYLPEIARELGFNGSRFGNEVVIYNSAFATRIDNKINWANKANSERPHNFEHKDYIQLLVNVEDMFNGMSGDCALDLSNEQGGVNAIGNRIDNIKEYIISGNPLDYPEVAYSKYRKEITVTNGRHRAFVAHKFGQSFIPMFVYNDSIKEFKKKVRTKPITEISKRSDLNIGNWLSENYSDLKDIKKKRCNSG